MLTIFIKSVHAMKALTYKPNYSRQEQNGCQSQSRKLPIVYMILQNPHKRSRRDISEYVNRYSGHRHG
nr:hypothetical protein Iba_chr04aCG2310 [Ipomoea batatas]GMC83567.1 hypothetical protein Iba_chr04cCG3280 [Ipomoea batatas]GMC85524.1 hypothetical protein Iba_chr04dCG2240 [Ipomoea batatas]